MIKFCDFGKMKNKMSRMMSIMTKTIPTRIPSNTSLLSIFLIYIIPKKPVTIMVIIGTIILTCGRFELNIGLKISVKIVDIIHIKIPDMIANFIFIFKPKILINNIFKFKILNTFLTFNFSKIVLGS